MSEQNQELIDAMCWLNSNDAYTVDKTSPHRVEVEVTLFLNDGDTDCERGIGANLVEAIKDVRRKLGA